MANAIQVFNYEQREIRVIEKDSEPWFVAKDIADILEFRDAFNAIRSLDDDEKGTQKVSTPGGTQEMSIVNEPGLYKLIMRSSKPEAKAFQRWVTHDVLPQIRKTGSYSVNPEAVKRLELAEKRLEIQRKNADVRRAKLLQRMIERPEYPITDDSKRVLIHEVTLLTTGRAHPEILPDLTEKLYSATEVGAALGVSNREVHKIARALNIRPDEGTRNEYGVWKMGKSPYSARECPQLFFTEAGKDRITGALCVEEE